MNKLFKKTLQITFITAILFSQGIAFAQNNPAGGATGQPQPYTVLAPLPGTTNNPGCQANCQSDLSHYLPGLFDLLIGVGAVAAFVIITIFGFEYMLTDSLLNKQRAKEWVINALWGLGLIIFAYVILYTINPALLAGSLNIGSPIIANPATVTPGGSTGTGTGGTGTGGTGTGGTGTGSTGTGAVANCGTGCIGRVDPCLVPTSIACTTDQANRILLASTNNRNLSVLPACYQGAPACTNLANVTTATIQTTMVLQANCGCVIAITGGTEHQPSNALDISANTTLNQFLLQTTPPTPGLIVTRTINGQNLSFMYEAAGQQTPLVGGGVAISTGNHWHVTYP